MEVDTVKEKLNSLIQKKILFDQHGCQGNLSDNKVEEAFPVHVKLEQPDEEAQVKIETDAKTADQNNSLERSYAPEDQFSHISLHEILKEKKKALMQSTEILEILRARIKP